MTENDYSGKTVQIFIEASKPPVYFVNVHNTQGISNPDSHIWNSNNYNRARTTIENAITKDNAKFVIAFPFGFVVYSWGDGKDTPDFACIKNGEYKFSNNFTLFESPTSDPVFCPLENLIKAEETKIWCASKTIQDYYSTERQRLEIRMIHSDKSFS